MGEKRRLCAAEHSLPYHVPAVHHYASPQSDALPSDMETTARQNDAASHLLSLPPSLNLECHLLQVLSSSEKKISGLGKLPALHYAPPAF